jgi:hypothetical protein
MLSMVIVFVIYYLHFCKPKRGFPSLENKKQATKPPIQPMKAKNNLKRRLEELGIKSIIPTEELLLKRLGGMTIIRFNKILANSSKSELTISEAKNLTRWLASMTGQNEADIELLEPVAQEKEAAS